MNTQIQQKIADIKNKVLPVIEKYPIQRVGLFGSIVRGEDTKKSDVDILIKFSPGSELSLLDVSHIKLEIEDVLDKHVDLVEYHLVRPFLREYIIPTEVVIYEKNS